MGGGLFCHGKHRTGGFQRADLPEEKRIPFSSEYSLDTFVQLQSDCKCRLQGIICMFYQ